VVIGWAGVEWFADQFGRNPRTEAWVDNPAAGSYWW